MKVPQQIWQPVGGDAGQSPHADHVGLQALDLAGLFLRRPILIHQPLYIGVQLRPLQRQLGPGAGADQQLNGQLLFQRRDHLSHGGLGITQGLRGPGEAAQLHDFLQSEITVHKNHHLF